MNKRELILANKIIAPFMDWKLSTIRGYHENWSWLMEVVEKIETLKFHPRWTVEYRVVIKRNFCQIDIGEGTIGNDGTFVNVDDTKILAVHGAAVKFIEWYSNITK